MKIYKILCIFILSVLIIIGLEFAIHKNKSIQIQTQLPSMKITSNVSDGEIVPEINGYLTGVPLKYREQFLICEDSVSLSSQKIDCNKFSTKKGR